MVLFAVFCQAGSPQWIDCLAPKWHKSSQSHGHSNALPHWDSKIMQLSITTSAIYQWSYAAAAKKPIKRTTMVNVVAFNANDIVL